jgi:diguanylate cyclase (GGDEF)-like protein
LNKQISGPRFYPDLVFLAGRFSVEKLITAAVADFFCIARLSPGRRKMTRILIVDDDAHDRRLISSRLMKSSADVEVHEADNHENAIRIAKSMKIDVVLLDLNLIESDGLVTLQRFTAECVNMPVVVLTGSTDEELGLKAIASGAQDFIRKSDIGNPWLYRCITNAITRFELQQALKTELTQDSLTGLPKRATFEGMLQAAFDRYDGTDETAFAVVYVDLDEFKLINDCFGHAIGDEVLIEFGRRAQGCCRATDLVARFGGDEFVVLLESIKSEGDINNFVNRFYEALSAPLSFDGEKVFLSASVGYVASCGRYEEYEAMLRDADTAMYEAKKSGKSKHLQFSQRMRDDSLMAIGLESRMRMALENGEFEVYYQPIVDLQSCETLQFEALVRWNHPERGIIMPLDFIPHVEQTGLIIQLGQTVLESVCRQIRAWDDAFPGNEIGVNVNVSNVQARVPEFAENVFRTLTESRLDSHRVTLEITESTIMEDPEETIKTLQKIREFGLKVGIDDFGTGHSSLSKLHRIGFDCLKIDRSFVKELLTESHAEVLVETIILLAKSLGLDVVAEGIESQEEADRLVEMGCNVGQGFFYGKPMPAADASRLVESNSTVAQSSTI